MSYFDNFDFARAYPEAGELRIHMKHISQKDRNGSGSFVGTMFNRWEVEAHRRLFDLAKNDPAACAALAKLICWGDDRARFTQHGR